MCRIRIEVVYSRISAAAYSGGVEIELRTISVGGVLEGHYERVLYSKLRSFRGSKMGNTDSGDRQVEEGHRTEYVTDSQ